MMTSSNGSIFRVTGHLCGEFTVSGEFPAQRPMTRSFDIFSYLRLNKRLSKQSWGWWFETLSCSLWRQCNVSSHTTQQCCKRRILYFANHNHNANALNVVKCLKWSLYTFVTLCVAVCIRSPVIPYVKCYNNRKVIRRYSKILFVPFGAFWLKT